MPPQQVSVGAGALVDAARRVGRRARARVRMMTGAVMMACVVLCVCAGAVRAAVPTVPSGTSTTTVAEGSRTTVTFPGADADGHDMEVLIVTVASLGATYVDALDTELPSATTEACSPDVTARVLSGQTTMSYAAPCVDSPTETSYSTVVTYILRDSNGLCSAESTLTISINVYDSTVSRFLRACSAKWTTRTGVSTVDAVDWWSNPTLPLSAADAAANGQFPKVVGSSAVVYGWGDNSVAQLALGHTNPTVVPETNAHFEEVKQFTYIAAAEKMVFGIEHTTGYVWGWGYDVSGALGLQTTGSGAKTVSKTPARIGDLTNVVKIAVGTKHAAALSKDGYVYTWGSDSEGQLGRGWTPGALQYVHSEAFARNKSLPARVVNNGFRTLVISDIAAGSSHTLALTSNGDIWAWGSNLDGQLGLEPCEVSRYGDGSGGCSSFPNAPEMAYTDSPMYLPFAYDSSGTNLIGGIKFKSISASARYSMAITDVDQTSVAGGQLYTWGLGETGQLGHGSTGSTVHLDPRRVVAPRPVETLNGVEIIFAAAGEFHAAAVASDGNLYTWGLNTYGQLGHNDRVNRYSPVLVSALADANVNISWVSCGRSHTIAVSDFGEVFTWGSNEFGQLGLQARPAENAAYDLSLTLRGWKQTAATSRRRLLAADSSTYSVLFNDFVETPDLSGGVGAAHASFQAAVMGTARPYSEGYLAIADIGMYGEVEYVASPVIVEGVQQVSMAVAIGGSSLALRISCNVGSERDTNSGLCVECSAGYFTNDFTSFDCTACPKGQYQNLTGSSSCVLCERGTYAEIVGRDACTGCSPGTFVPFSGATSESQCENCPEGSYSASSGSSECTPCESGTYQVISGQSSCTNCDEGSFNPTTGARRATACLKCPAGKFAESTGTSECSTCPAGFYSAAPGASSCDECPLGTYSPGGLSECIACPRGTIGNASAVMASVDNCISCQRGFYMPSSGQSECLECPDGTYSDIEGASSCTQCPAGYVGNGVIVAPRASLDAACQECQIGTYTATRGSVALNAQFCTLCESGTYQDEIAQTSCKPCPAGTYGVNVGSSSVADCNACGAGKYAEFTGMSACIDCAPGTYGPADRTDTSACIGCGAGTYSIAYGAAIADDCDECQPGYFALAGQACQQCEPGTYQDETRADQCKLCPAGTFLTAYGAIAEAECEQCPVGTFSSVAGSTECTPCAAGSYSDTPGAATCSLCPVGTELPLTGSTSADACQDCPVGSVSTAEGTASCTLCATGTYSAITRASVCVNCPEGSYNAIQGSISSDACILCDLGSFADVAGSAACTLCLEGTYADELGMIECKPAPAGYFLAGTGSTSADSVEACALGTFSDVEGSAACTNCAAGTYGNDTALTACTDCPSGTFSAVEGNTSPDNCNDCQIGTYSISGSVACTQCPAGTYANVIGLEQCIGCPAGKYGTAIGATSETSCLNCAPGTYSATEGTQQCIQCPAGKYADEPGLVICKDCKPGTYGSVVGATVGDDTICLPCPLGTASIGGLSACPQCLPGTYAAEQGLQNCTLCPAGTYGVDTGAKAVERCDRCPLYHFNSTPGSNTIEACVYFHSATGRAFTTSTFIIAFILTFVLCC